jgi:ATP-dependent 26S proteasome regulatory subunit
VPGPDTATQIALLNYFASRCNLPAETVTSLQAELREGMSGADVENVCREAGMTLLRTQLEKEREEREEREERKGS